MVLQTIFRVLASLVSVYTFICFVRIILTWIPSLSYSRFTNFLARITDPYLNLFRGIRWLRMGSFDFSPAVGLCLLSVASSLLSHFSHMARFSIGSILSMIVELAWSLASSILTFILIMLIVRLVLILIKKDDYYSQSPILDQLDRSIAPLVHNISKTFTGGKKITYKSALIIASVSIFVVQIVGSLLFSWIATLISSLPF